MPRPVTFDGTPDEVVMILAKAGEQRSPDQRKKLTAYYATLDPEFVKLREAEANHAQQAPPPPATKAQTLTEISPARKTHIHVRGDFLRKGEEVQPHTPAVLHPLANTGAGRPRDSIWPAGSFLLPIPLPRG